MQYIRKLLSISIIASFSFGFTSCLIGSGEEENGPEIIYRTESPLPVYQNSRQDEVAEPINTSIQQEEVQESYSLQVPSEEGEIVEAIEVIEEVQTEGIAVPIENQIDEADQIIEEYQDIKSTQNTTQNRIFQEVEVKTEESIKPRDMIQVTSRRIDTEEIEGYSRDSSELTQPVEQMQVLSSSNIDSSLNAGQPTNANRSYIPSNSYDPESEDIPDPSAADIGQCYGKVKIAGEYKIIKEKVLVEPKKTKSEVIPAQFDFVEEQVVIKEPTVKFIEIPARYETVQETVIIEPAKTREVRTPAKYETVEERVLVEPAKKVWKKGRGLIERVSGDGSIMCLVEEPAKYETVQKRVLVEPEKINTVTVPAVTKTITKQVVVEPARVEKITVPAITQTVQKKVITEPEKTVKIEIPPIYKSVDKKIPTSKDRIRWMPIVCEDNINKDLVFDLQAALTARGYDTGGVDGIFGRKTSSAIGEFQKSLGLKSAGITIRTLQELGISK
jgi:hypothetical protein